MLCFLGYLKYSNGDGNIVILKKKNAERVKMNGERKEGGTLRFQFTYKYSFNGVLWHCLTVSNQLFQSVIICFRLWQKMKANLL